MYFHPIVEGHGERDAVPLLFRRIAKEIGNTFVEVGPPHRIKFSAFRQFGDEFKRAIQLGAEKAKDNSGIVVIVLDCEDDCPAQLGPRIKSEAIKLRPDVTIEVFLAYREFETWFMFAAESFAGHEGLPSSLNPPPNPESIRGAKEWFGKQMPRGYKETTHQASFTSKFDLNQAQSSHSFKRLVDRISQYLT